MTNKQTLAPADLLALVNEAQSPAQARHVVGQATMREPRIAQLVALFDQLDERGKISTLAMLAVAVKLHPKE